MATQLTRRALLQASMAASACTVIGAASAVNAADVGISQFGPSASPGVFALSTWGAAALVGVVVDQQGISLRLFKSSGPGLYIGDSTLALLPATFIPAGLVADGAGVVVYGGETFTRSTLQFNRGTAAAKMRAPFASPTLQLAPSIDSVTITGVRPAAYRWSSGDSAARPVLASLPYFSQGMFLSTNAGVDSAVLAVTADDPDLLTLAVLASRTTSGSIETGASVAGLGDSVDLAIPPVAIPAYGFLETGVQGSRQVVPFEIGGPVQLGDTRKGSILSTASSQMATAALIDTGDAFEVWDSVSGWRKFSESPVAGEDVVGISGGNSVPVFGATLAADQVRVLSGPSLGG
jgi:hypothetical protein